MSLAHTSHSNGNLVETQRRPVKEIGQLWGAVDSKMVRAVHGTVGSHSDLNTQGFEHFLGGGQATHSSPPRRPAGDIDGRRVAAELDPLSHAAVSVDCVAIPKQQLKVGSSNDVTPGAQVGKLRFEPVLHRGGVSINQFGGVEGARTSTVEASQIGGGHLGQRSDVFEPAGIQKEARDELTHSGSVDQFEYFFTNSVVEAKRIERVAGQKHRGIPDRQWQPQERVVQEGKVLGEQFGHGKKLSSFVTSGWPSSHVGGTRRGLSSGDDTIHTVIGSRQGTHSGSDAPIAVGFDNDKRASVDSAFLPGVAHPVRRVHTTEVLSALPERTLFVPTVVDLHDRNVDNGFVDGGHRLRLAEHDPSMEVACPQCGQHFLDNGWTGFTPILSEGYGQRSWQCPTCLNDLKEISNRPMKTAGSWDPTTCEHCGHPMTDPQMVGNRWMNHCTNCGKYREVPTKTPLLQQQLRNWPPYPEELQSVDPGRAWMAVGKFAKVSGDLSQTLRHAMNPPPLTEATGRLPCRDCGTELVPNDDPKRTYYPDHFPPYMCPNCGRLYMESELTPPDTLPHTWSSGRVGYDHEESVINTATMLVQDGMDIAEAARWLENALVQGGRSPQQAQAISDEIFMGR